jgi:hypothetical protein
VLREGLRSTRIAPASLLCKPEESEERKSIKDIEPATKLKTAHRGRDAAPNFTRILVDSGEVRVCFRPSLPWGYSPRDVPAEHIAAETDSTDTAEPGETHEANVSMIGKMGAGQELVILLAALVEC